MLTLPYHLGTALMKFLLLVFARREDGASTRQRALLRGHEAAFDDRDLLPLTYLDDEGSIETRRRCGVGAGEFAAILVGKDGTEKFRSDEPVRPETLFALIDAMPMRRREVRDRRGRQSS